MNKKISVYSKNTRLSFSTCWEQHCNDYQKSLLNTTLAGEIIDLRQKPTTSIFLNQYNF